MLGSRPAPRLGQVVRAERAFGLFENFYRPMHLFARVFAAFRFSIHRLASRLRSGGIACLLGGATVLSGAQSVRVDASATPGGPASDWRTLQALVLVGDSRSDPSFFTASREETQAGQTAAFLKLAAQARKFQADYPNENHSKDAKVLEARSLLKAALVGDQTQRSRAFALADALKYDLTADPAARFDVAFLEQQVLVRSFAPNREDFVAASMVAARNLIAAYPDQNGGYEWLLVVAEQANNDAQFARAAREVLEWGAPDRARAQAQILTERFELVGKSLANYANTALGRDNFFEQSRTRRTVLYTWDAREADSVAWAADLERQLPDDVLVIGVCLSKDVGLATDLAQRMGLSAWQYYSGGGAGSFLALRLKLSRSRLIYVTNASDTIVTVTARENNVSSFLGK